MKYGVFTNQGEKMIALVPETEDERILISRVEAAIGEGKAVAFNVDIYETGDEGH